MSILGRPSATQRWWCADSRRFVASQPDDQHPRPTLKMRSPLLRFVPLLQEMSHIVPRLSLSTLYFCYSTVETRTPKRQEDSDGFETSAVTQ
jgi:hypothetical protein